MKNDTRVRFRDTTLPIILGKWSELSIGKLGQPDARQYRAEGDLPFVTDTFKNLLEIADTSGDTPSCSLAEALTKQDLFINSSLANMGASLLWQLFREGFIINRGFFINLRDFRTQPIKVTVKEDQAPAKTA